MAPDAKNIETQHDMGLFYHCTPYREKGQYMADELRYKIIIYNPLKNFLVPGPKSRRPSPGLAGEGNGELLGYLVPNSRSPASPRPGTI